MPERCSFPQNCQSRVYFYTILHIEALRGVPAAVHDFTELWDEADGDHVLPDLAIEGEVVQEPQ